MRATRGSAPREPERLGASPVPSRYRYDRIVVPRNAPRCGGAATVSALQDVARTKRGMTTTEASSERGVLQQYGIRHGAREFLHLAGVLGVELVVAHHADDANRRAVLSTCDGRQRW